MNAGAPAGDSSEAIIRILDDQHRHTLPGDGVGVWVAMVVMDPVGVILRRPRVPVRPEIQRTP